MINNNKIINMKKVYSLYEYCEAYTGDLGANPSTEADVESFDLDTALLDELVELVGSEEEVELAAQEAHEELIAAQEEGSLEGGEDMIPEKLAVAALIVKLVEMGKLSPEEADSFIEKNID
jgi:hypothetical protein